MGKIFQREMGLTPGQYRKNFLDLKQAYPVDFSMGEATDFFGAVNTRLPRAA
jgi:hypothetical protein